MSLDKYKLPSLGDKIREQAVKENEANEAEKVEEVEDVEVKVKKGRRLNK